MPLATASWLSDIYCCHLPFHSEEQLYLFFTWKSGDRYLSTLPLAILSLFPLPHVNHTHIVLFPFIAILHPLHCLPPFKS